MIVDVNVLLYAIDSESPKHEACRGWLEGAFNGSARVGLPWPTILGFLRIATHPRIMRNPLTTAVAWEFVDLWLAQRLAWIPGPTEAHADALRALTTEHRLEGNGIPDAHLAALAIEHGVPVVSCDTDFARFTELSWVDPSRLAR